MGERFRIMSPIAPGKGTAIIDLLKNPRNFQAQIFSSTHLTDEFEHTDIWPHFVKFPEKLAQVFPGSYITPRRFLKELGVDETRIASHSDHILSRETGTVENPAFQYIPKNTNHPAFSLSVLNGMANEHALAMTRLAVDNGITDPLQRAQYQDHMYSSIIPFIEDKTKPDFGIRFFDDCIASGDSIAGYLFRLSQDPNMTERLKNGVEIVAVTATAQSTLFLKEVAKSLHIKLNIKVGQVGFGLTEGTKKPNGAREHANYITYPQELLTLLPDNLVQELESYRSKITGLIQVVGDMGETETGIEDFEMKVIRNIFKDQEYCWWNDMREDGHGAHPNHHRLVHPKGTEHDKPLLIYLARGGYLPYEWDKKKNPHFHLFDKLIERASRLWTKEKGYGVGMKDK